MLCFIKKNKTPKQKGRITEPLLRRNKIKQQGKSYYCFAIKQTI